MHMRIIGASLLALLITEPLLAQTSGDAAAKVAPRTSVSNDDFRRLALIAEVFDTESSRLALERSTRRSIKRYANALATNGRFNYARLSAGKGIFSGIPDLRPGQTNVPSFTDPRRAAMLNQLAASTGRSFDRLYTDMQLGTRQEVLGLYETYLQSGSDATLLAIARERLPVLQQEYAAARRLARR